MGTFNGGKANARKERAKAINRGKKEQLDELNKELKANGVEKLEYDIARLRNTISLCEFDLSGAFKGSIVITNKLEFAKKQLLDKQRELEKLKNEK